MVGRTFRGLDRKYKLKEYQKYKKERKKRLPEDKKKEDKNEFDDRGNEYENSTFLD